MIGSRNNPLRLRTLAQSPKYDWGSSYLGEAGWGSDAAKMGKDPLRPATRATSPKSKPDLGEELSKEELTALKELLNNIEL
jgi:hypothetical protein